MVRQINICTVLLLLPLFTVAAQELGLKSQAEEDWDRTRMIMGCAPRLVDRRDLVEDNFDHRYVTNNPRDIEVGYFSVEPITYLEEGRRFCEAHLPAAGVSESYFRGCYVTTYTLPGDRVYSVQIESAALIFHNEIQIINAQQTLGEIEASHHMEIEVDTTLNPALPSDLIYKNNPAFTWIVEIDQSGRWHGELQSGNFELIDSKVPAGISKLSIQRKIRGPGVINVRESVVFKVNAMSSFKYDPIFQADCLFSLEALSVSSRLLPCEE